MMPTLTGFLPNSIGDANSRKTGGGSLNMTWEK